MMQGPDQSGEGSREDLTGELTPYPWATDQESEELALSSNDEVTPGEDLEVTPPADLEVTPRSGAYGERDRAAEAEASPPVEKPEGAAPELGSDESLDLTGQPRPGQVLFGRYLVVRQLGEGGMGSVWLVRHLELDAERALKLIVSGIAFDPQARARFKREARVMARLSHPNAVIVHNARIGRDAAFIEMEYIRGQSLNKLLQPGVPMPLDWTARILEQLCDVLQAAHDLKIVHRDLKPANLMLVEGRPAGKELLKVLDFGIAKVLEAELTAGDVQTRSGCFMGSAAWSSPEQASDGHVDGRSDLYAVGVILYEFLTGHRPFSGPLTKVLYDHLYTPPPPFAAKNPRVAVPPAIERVVLRCMAKRPDDRPQCARALYEEFAAALPRGPMVSPGFQPYPSSGSAHAHTEPMPQLAPGTPQQTEPAGWYVPSPVAPPSTEVASSEPAEISGQQTEPAMPGAADAPRSHPGATTEPEPRDYPPVDDVPTMEKPAPAAPSTRYLAGRRRVLMILLALLAVPSLLWALLRPPSQHLPQGYRAEDPRDRVGAYPRSLIRERDGTRFIRIEGGSFRMGNHFDSSGSDEDDDQPAHPVRLSDYYLQETEVTNGELEAYFQAHNIGPAERPKRWQEAYDAIKSANLDPTNYPARGVPHELAEQYARSVGGRLPTEAQWEYAARSRGKPKRYVGEFDEKPTSRTVNIDLKERIGGIPVSPVGFWPKDQTEQGIRDLTGNVREWCRDVYAEYQETSEPLVDPEGPPPPQVGTVEYVIRGGSFLTFAADFRTTRPRRPYKDELTARELAEDQTARDVGFRVVLEWPPKHTK